MDEVALKLQTLAVLRPMCLHFAWNALWAKGSEQQAALRSCSENLKGIQLLGESLGIPLTAHLVFTARPALVGGLTTVLMNNCIRDHQLGLLIRKTFGPSEALRFLFVELISILALSSGFLRIALSASAPRTSASHWRDECKAARQLCTGLASVIPTRRSDLMRLFSHQASLQFLKLVPLLRGRRMTRPSWSSIERYAQHLIASLVPHTIRIEETRERARALWDELVACKAGRPHWRKYETICTNILRFVFVPPFRTLTVQARTEDGFERRDVILSNSQHSEFWQTLRDELGSRHIVCEFKNVKNGGKKVDLNQLRIYLSKRTVGRFGLLFLRNPPSASLRKAQRDAYEQSGILVLILHDELVESLLMARVFLGSVVNVLEREKIAFEVAF